MKRPFDILVNGYPEKTLWAENAEAAIIQAYINGLRVNDGDSVTASKRFQDEDDIYEISK